MPTPLLRGFVVAALLGAVATITGVLAQNVDPFGEGRKYAWGENVGWINAAPNGMAGPGAHVTGTHVTGYVWGENIGWINLSCQNNNTCGATGNYGVRNDGVGNLSGYAWGENVGWISFSCTNVPATCTTTGNYGVSIDPATGEWSGHAWGENIGWINFSHGQLASRVVSDDLDGVAYPPDNCPFDFNPGQEDLDGDGAGDACDIDIDGDWLWNDEELLIVSDPFNVLDPEPHASQRCTAPAGAQRNFMRSDVTRAGFVTAFDISTVISRLDSERPYDRLDSYRSDVQCSGFVTAFDLSTVISNLDAEVNP